MSSTASAVCRRSPVISFAQFVNKTHGEPLNVIISGLSDPFILSEDGLHIYAKCVSPASYLLSPLTFDRSLGYSEECLGLHYGNRHLADLGDGDGKKVEQYLARQYYFPVWGTCWESLAGKFTTTFLSDISSLITATLRLVFYQAANIFERGNRTVSWQTPELGSLGASLLKPPRFPWC